MHMSSHGARLLVRGVILGGLILTGCAGDTIAGGSAPATQPALARQDQGKAAAAVQPGDPDSEPDTEPAVVYQNEEEALAADNAQLAKEAGLPIEQVEQSTAFQEAFGAYAEDLLSRYPDQISAVWTEPVPGAIGHVQFIADVPAEVTAELKTLRLLGPNNVVLTEGGLISMADHIRRAELTAEALVGLGYQNIVTFFDQPANVIRIELQLPQGTAPPSAAALAGAMQTLVQADQNERGEPRLRGRAAIVETRDFDLSVRTDGGPIITIGTQSPLTTMDAPSPLATWDPSTSGAFTYAAVGEGTLDIAAGCVRLLLSNGTRVLLIWPEPTSWNAASHTIEFVGPRRGERVNLRHGDQIAPGGAGAQGIPPGMSPPDPACQADEIFIVNDVGVVTAE